MTTGNPTPTKAITGGEFLIRDVSADEIFTPEEWTEEHRMMLQTGLDFVAQRIIPNLERIEAQEEGLTPKRSRKWVSSACSAAPCRKSSVGLVWTSKAPCSSPKAWAVRTASP